MTKVAIIVVNYRTPHETLAAVRSLRQLTYPDFEIIVVDNASGDGSATLLRHALARDGDAASLPPVILLEAPENRGYTGGYNRGCTLALGRHARYLHLVNPDTTVINDNYLTELVGALERHPRVGQIGPRVHCHAVGKLQNTVLRFPWLWRRVLDWLPARLGRIRRPPDTPAIVEALNGVCVLIRAECWRAVGGFDERLFAYLEDIDWAFRAAAAGWDRAYLPVDSLLHLQKMVGYERTGPVDFLLKRNTLYFLLKHGRKLQAAGYTIAVLLLGLARLALAKRRLWAATADWLRRLLQAYCGLWRGQIDDVMHGRATPQNLQRPEPSKTLRLVASRTAIAQGTACLDDADPASLESCSSVPGAGLG